MQVGNRCLATHSEVRDVQKNMLNPFAPGNFAKNDDFEAIRAVFWSLPGCNDPQLTKNAYYLGLLLQLQNISFQNFLACAESKLSRVFGLILTFYYRFIYSPCFSLFLPRFFSLLLRNYQASFGFISVFGKAFRILGLDGRKATIGW